MKRNHHYSRTRQAIRLLQLVATTLLCVTTYNFALAAEYERRDVAFASQGLKCSGWLYVPKNLRADEKRPAIVLAHGWSAVKDHLDRYAAKFAEGGFVVLAFDYRYFGASEGEPRGQLFFLEQQTDYRNAISWVSLQKEVDAQRIGIWGTSYSGGHVLHVSAFDKRVKAVVAQVPVPNSWKAFYEPLKPEDLKAERELYLKARMDRYTTGHVTYVPSVAPEGEYSSNPGKEPYEWFMANMKPYPTWKNQVTLESHEDSMQYDPTAFIHLIAPTPLLMIVTSNDTLTPTALQKEAFGRAHEPKRIVEIRGGHFEVYQGSGLETAATAALEWFKQALMKQ